jgi:hypothetical protein
MTTVGNRTIPADYHLPNTPDNAVAETLKLAEIFGTSEVYAFLGLMHGNNSPIGEVRALLGASLVIAEMRENPALDYFAARLSVGKRLGYAGTSLSNWNKVSDRGRDTLRAKGMWDVGPRAGQ